MTKKISISVIMTCFNRRKKTVACLKSLLLQEDVEQYEINFFICDDGSTDGTSSAVLELCPSATVVKGTGNLFWAKGMAKALKAANLVPCDFYLMVNDDVSFERDMLKTMMESFYALDCEGAISGAFKDPITGDYSYGGERIIKRGFKEKTVEVLPNGEKMNFCDRANWNCFLISQDYYKRIGDIDDYYAHSYADYDYSNRIVQTGGKIGISFRYVGTCSRNSKKNTWMDSDLSTFERLKKLHRPNGIPIKSAIHYWGKFDRKYFIFRIARPYLAIFKDCIRKKRNSNLE